jgi:hypothetical protein
MSIGNSLPTLYADVGLSGFYSKYMALSKIIKVMPRITLIRTSRAATDAEIKSKFSIRHSNRTSSTSLIASTIHELAQQPEIDPTTDIVALNLAGDDFGQGATSTGTLHGRLVNISYRAHHLEHLFPLLVVRGGIDRGCFEEDAARRLVEEVKLLINQGGIKADDGVSSLSRPVSDVARMPAADLAALSPPPSSQSSSSQSFHVPAFSRLQVSMIMSWSCGLCSGCLYWLLYVQVDLDSAGHEFAAAARINTMRDIETYGMLYGAVLDGVLTVTTVGAYSCHCTCPSGFGNSYSLLCYFRSFCHRKRATRMMSRPMSSRCTTAIRR